MKKRRQRNTQSTKNESMTNESIQIQEVSMVQNENVISDMKSNVEQVELQKKGGPEPQKEEKPYLESAKQKLSSCFNHFLNYLQFDQVFTKQEFEALKTEQYVIKTRFPDNYYLTYEQRAKTFAVTLEDAVKKKQQEEENKQKSLWIQLKKFVCCEGEDQLEQADEMLTAATQSQFYYLTKAKKYSTDNQKLQITQESMLQKPYKQRQFKNVFQKPNRKMVRQQTSSEKHDDIFLGSNLEDNIIFEDDKPSKASKNTSINKTIDLNALKKVNKRQHRNNQNLENNSISSQASGNAGSKNKITTEKVFIQKRQSVRDQGQQSKDNSPVKSIEQRFVEQIKSDNEDDVSQINQVVRLGQKSSESTLSPGKHDLASLKNTWRTEENNIMSPIVHFRKNSNISLEASSNNNSTDKMTPFVSNDFDMVSCNNGFGSQNNSTFAPMDDSDIISVTHSENQQLSTDNKIRKKNKRKNKRKKPQQELQVIQHNLDMEEELVDTSLAPDYSQDQQIKQLQKNDDIPIQKGLKKARKNTFKFDTFNGLNSPIKQSKQEDDNDRRQLNEISFDERQSLNLSQGGERSHVFKKKKVRNKKILNHKEEDEEQNQVVFFANDEQSSQNPVSNTINFGQDVLSNSAISEGTGAKKRRKNKKLKDMSLQTNQQTIVIEASQMLEQMEKQTHVQPQQNLVQSSEFNLASQTSGAMGSVKVEKKKKRKAKLRQELQRQEEEVQIVDLGQLNQF